MVKRGVCVLLRLDDPGEEMGELDDPVHLEPVRSLDGVEVGRVRSTRPLRPSSSRR